MKDEYSNHLKQNKMERKEQTGHICRWIALGIIAASIIVGCAILIGLFEWRDRKVIEDRNTELHEWRKNVHELNMHIVELSLLGETVTDWDSLNVSDYRTLRIKIDDMLDKFGNMCPKEKTDSIRLLLKEKEGLLLQTHAAVNKQDSILALIDTTVPKIVKTSRKSAVSPQPPKGKRSFWKRLFKKREKRDNNRPQEIKDSNIAVRQLAYLNDQIIKQRKEQSVMIANILDSLTNRNETINIHLQRIVSLVDKRINQGISERERQIEDMEGNYTYYYMGTASILILLLAFMFMLVRRNKKRTDRLIDKLAEKNQQNMELIQLRRQTIQAITHELRMPLSTILHSVKQMETAENYAKMLYSLEDTALNMEQMLNDLLDYFRLDNGKETLSPKPFAIRGLCTKLSSEFAGLADKKGITLTVESKSDDIVLGDKIKILRIGRNLLSNALKFTESGSVNLILNYTDGKFLLSVSDTGSGMDDKDKEKIFGAFCQLGNAATKDGFGLGLSIVKNLVEMMDGKVEVTTKKGVGSTFTIEMTLPLVHENDIDKESIAKPSNGIEAIAIDDNELMLQRLQGMFAEKGVRCDICTGVDELLSKMREKEYDILFTDLKMQGANGYDVLKILRMSNIRNSKTIPVVVQTGAAGITEVDMKEKGFSGYIQKPFSSVELLNVTNKLANAGNGNNKPININLAPLYEYGEKERTLLLFKEETEDNICRLDKAVESGNRHELKEILHSMRGTWELIGCGATLNKVFSVVKDTSFPFSDVAKGINEIKKTCIAIIKAVIKEDKIEKP